MRLQIDGGKTEYDGPYATQKYSYLSISKSKVSPIMNDIPIIIDITKGGVIDRGGSLVWWITNLTSPTVFKQSAWWSIEDDFYVKYKPIWDKFGGFYPKFRQSRLYEVGRSDNNFVDFLQLIWLDLISEKYVLQREVCKSMRDSIEMRLLTNLGINYEELYPQSQEEVVEDQSSCLEELSAILSSESTDTEQ